MSIVIRRSDPADAPALESLVAEMQDLERTLDPRLLEGRSMARDYTAAMHERCRTDDGQIFVAEEDGAVVGFVTVLVAVPTLELDQPPGTHALISDLSVTAVRRSRGIGRALLDASVAFARSRGATELRIDVLADNVAADRLYRSYGFTPYLISHTLDLR